MQSPTTFHIRPSTFAAQRQAFTLVELLVVIAIIAVLLGILVPVIGKVRIAGYETNTKALITQLDQACQAYYTDYQAYPGPLPNSFLDATDQSNPPAPQTAIGWLKSDGTSGGPLGGTAAAGGVVTGNRVTATENLVLGLCGGLVRQGVAPAVTYAFSVKDLGTGPRNFNPIRPSKAAPYFPTGRSLFTYQDSLKHFEDDPSAPAGTGPGATMDSAIPEFIDGWPDGMPILYMRARAGAVSTNATPTKTDNSIVTAEPGSTVSQYNLIEVTPYTLSTIGIGKSAKMSDYTAYSATKPHGLNSVDPGKTTNKTWTANYQYPFDAYDYFSDPASYDRSAAAMPTNNARQARKKDAYVLISAGRDRIYGTADDVTNFGSVLP